MKALEPYSGLAISLILGSIALIIGQYLPLIGASIIALILGMVLNNGFGVKPCWQVGLTYAGKNLLQWAIILLGFTFSLNAVTAVGLSSLKISLVTIGIAFLVAYTFGKKLKLPQKLALLIGFGTAICGGSAIAAASPIIEANDDEIALSLSTIFFFNLVAVFTFPLFGHLLGMSDHIFGLWAGTAINDTSSVLAAAYTYSQEAGDYATIVKLVRSLMIMPSCLAMVAIRHNQSKYSQQSLSLKKVFPWFILWFLLASFIASIGILPSHYFGYAKKLSQLFMAMALVGIGSKVSLTSLKQAGLQPILLGATTWMAVAISALLLEYMWLR